MGIVEIVVVEVVVVMLWYVLRSSNGMVRSSGMHIENINDSST